MMISLLGHKHTHTLTVARWPSIVAPDHTCHSLRTTKSQKLNYICFLNKMTSQIIEKHQPPVFCVFLRASRYFISLDRTHKAKYQTLQC